MSYTLGQIIGGILVGVGFFLAFVGLLMLVGFCLAFGASLGWS